MATWNSKLSREEIDALQIAEIVHQTKIMVDENGEGIVGCLPFEVRCKWHDGADPRKPGVGAVHEGCDGGITFLEIHRKTPRVHRAGDCPGLPLLSTPPKLTVLGEAS